MYLMYNGVTQATPLFRCPISSCNLTGAFIDCVTDLGYVTVILGKYLKLVPSGAPFDDIEDDVDLIVIFLRGHFVSGVGVGIL